MSALLHDEGLPRKGDLLAFFCTPTAEEELNSYCNDMDSVIIHATIIHRP